MSRILAIIGTAGRDKTRRMDRALWSAMLEEARRRVRSGDILISGGAAWADHLAVAMFQEGRCAGLELYLPAPLVETPEGWSFGEAGGKSAGAAANYYHRLFTAATGTNGIADIAAVRALGAIVHEETATPGFSAMFARNRNIAYRCNAALAFTFSAGERPADGGTLNTWEQIRADDRVHIDLQALQQRSESMPQASDQGSPSRAQRFR